MEEEKKFSGNRKTENEIERKRKKEKKKRDLPI